MKENSEPGEIEQKSIDHVLTAVRAVVGPLPIVGPLLGELAGVIVPNQRIDRISKFAVELEQRVRSLEHAEELKEQLGSEHFTDLLEEGIRQAARSLSDERRRYIASLIVSGLSAENIAHAESRHLLRTLDEINDVEVIWLNVHQETIVGDDEVFWKKHESVLQPAVAALGSSTQELDKHTLQESYKEHLCQLGLLERRYQMNLRTRQPEFDRNGKQKIQGYEITSFGALLLRHIGLGEA